MAEHGQLGAYWISEHLMKPLARSHFCSLTGFAASTQVLSSSRSQLPPPPDCNFCWREVQLYLSSCRFRFLHCHPIWHPSWAVLVEYWSNCGEKPASVTMSDSFFYEMKWRSSSTVAILSFSVTRTCIAERVWLSIWTGGVPATTTRTHVCYVTCSSHGWAPPKDQPPLVWRRPR